MGQDAFGGAAGPGFLAVGFSAQIDRDLDADNRDSVPRVIPSPLKPDICLPSHRMVEAVRTMKARISGDRLFHRAGGDATDHVFLGEDEEHDDRQCGENQASHGEIVAVGILAKERIGHQRQRALVLVKNERGQKEVVPNPQGIENGHGRDDRLELGENQIPENTEVGSAIDLAGFVDVLGNLGNEPAKQESRQSCAEAEVEEHQRQPAIEHMQPAKDADEGDHQRPGTG